ncbi:MAG: hypothetical protein DI535_28845 [Citrobacter freundii]|nr:MAG: hypothetical protein DI535_28845 [Citrobacter freundii]
MAALIVPDIVSGDRVFRDGARKAPATSPIQATLYTSPSLLTGWRKVPADFADLSFLLSK